MKNLQGNLKTLKKNGFQNAKPYPHISIDEFLHNDLRVKSKEIFLILKMMTMITGASAMTEKLGETTQIVN